MPGRSPGRRPPLVPRRPRASPRASGWTACPVSGLRCAWLTISAV